jgi:hypothetical protein
MILSGLKSRSILETDSLAFDLDLSLSKINGSGEFGFSGENKTLNFKFISGRIYDFNGNYVYSYLANESFNISGDIQTGSYIYYINQDPVGINNKNNFKISKFYTNSMNCGLDVDLNIRSSSPNYDLNINNFYYTGGYLSGNFINNITGFAIKVFSGQVTQNTGFSLYSIPSNINQTGNILISTNPIPATYNLRLYLYTNFGTINKSFVVSGLTGTT